jgi:hypothetical protein
MVADVLGPEGLDRNAKRRANPEISRQYGRAAMSSEPESQLVTSISSVPANCISVYMWH